MGRFNSPSGLLRAAHQREAARKLPEEDRMIGNLLDQKMEKEPLSMAVDWTPSPYGCGEQEEAEYGRSEK